MNTKLLCNLHALPMAQARSSAISAQLLSIPPAPPLLCELRRPLLFLLLDFACLLGASGVMRPGAMNLGLTSNKRKRTLQHGRARAAARAGDLHQTLGLTLPLTTERHPSPGHADWCSEDIFSSTRALPNMRVFTTTPCTHPARHPDHAG